jgi:5-methylthioadenosine/S-adenosylhomocysteine deaminase
MSDKTLVLRDADYVIQEATTIKENHSVLIKGHRVLDVAPYDELKANYTIDEERDCTGQAILPGLVNTHTHIHETMMRGLGHDFPFHQWCDRLVFPTAKAMEDEGEDLYRALTILTAMEAASSGSTALIEHSVNFAKRHSLTMAHALREFGLRGAIAKGAEDFSTIDQGHVGKDMDQELRETKVFLDAWRKEKPDDLVQAWVGPSGGKRTVGGCTNEALVELKKMADNYDTRFHLHWAGTSPEIKIVQRDTGYVGSVAMAYHLGILDERTSLAHCIWMAEAEMDMVKETGASIAHCPSCNQICAIGVLPLVELLEKGVTVGIGTDGAPQNDSLDMYRDMRQAVLLQRITKMKADAVSHLDAFRMATVNGAKMLGHEDLGTIEPSQIADLTAVKVRGNHFLTPLFEPLETLVYAGSGGRDTAWTMVNGEMVYDNGTFPTVDAEAVVNQVADAAKRIKRHIVF